MTVKPVYLRRKRTRKVLVKDTHPPVIIAEVSSETPKLLGFNPRATVNNSIEIAR